MYLTVFGMNKWLFDKIYFFTLEHSSLKKAAVLVSELSKPFFFAAYTACVLISFFKGCDMIKIIAVPLCTLVFNSLLRKLLNRPRPFLREDVDKLVDHKESGSFPSNHACSSMVIALSWILVCPLAVAFFAVLAFFTGLSRIMTGVHYPLDVLCGWLIGALSGIIFFLIL